MPDRHNYRTRPQKNRTSLINSEHQEAALQDSCCAHSIGDHPRQMWILERSLLWTSKEPACLLKYFHKTSMGSLFVLCNVFFGFIIVPYLTGEHVVIKDKCYHHVF